VAIEDIYYQPTAKDRISGLNPRRRVIVVTASAASLLPNAVSATPIALDTVFLVRRIAVKATPGAGVTCHTAAVYAGLPWPIGRLVSGFRFPSPVAAQVANASEHVDIILGPGEVISVDGEFSSPVAVNTVVATVWGIELARGNVEFG
jgi:hypothetical protein